jgi:hypothetical protein
MNQITRIAQIKTSVPLCEKIVLLCTPARKISESQMNQITRITQILKTSVPQCEKIVSLCTSARKNLNHR